MKDEDEILEQTPDRRYFTIMPNMLDDMGLSPYAVRLYLRLKRRAGDDGECWENTQHLAEGCNMSKSQISRSKVELEIAGLVTINKRVATHGHFPGHVITISDIWKDNIDFYDKYYPVSDRDRSCPPGGTRPVPVVVHKKNPIKKRVIEEKEKGLQKSQSSLTALEKEKPSFSQAVPKIVEDIKTITNYKPKKELWPLLIQKFPEGIEDMQRAKDIFTVWIAQGYNPQNLEGWLLDRYMNNNHYQHPKDKQRWKELMDQEEGEE